MNGTIGNGLLLLGAVLFIIAIVNVIRIGRGARSAAYYSLRQSALSRTRMWSVIAIVILAATIAWAAYLSNQPEPATTASIPTPAPAIAIATPSRLLPTDTPAVIPTLPPTPSPTPGSVSPTSKTTTATPIVYTATPLPPVTATLALPADLPAILRTPIAGAVNPTAGAQLSFTTLASAVDSKGAPVNPGLTFPVGTRNIRLFFQANKVNNGAVWSVLCYQGDQLVDNVRALWKWGTRRQSARAFCTLDGSTGPYRIETYLGPYKQFEVGFELETSSDAATAEATAAATTTPTPQP